jgi:cytidine deaminase
MEGSNVDYEQVLNSARDTAFQKMDYSQCGISGVKVGAAVVSRCKFNSIGIFGGCNLEIATSRVLHAELVALANSLSSGFTKIDSVHVTSVNVEQRAALCGYCRQDFMYINPDIMIYVYHADRSLKFRIKLIDTMNLPYLNKGKILHKTE